MIRMPILSVALVATIAACSTAQPSRDPSAHATVTADQPLQVLQAGVGLGEVRRDLIATAADRFGQAALEQAMSAPTHLIAKRFAGMLPPPPPGEETREYVPPAALLMKGPGGWASANATGWRPLRAEQAAEIERIIASSAFWSEAPTSLPCPDYGASLLMLKVPGKPETVRKSSCSSVATRR